MSANKLSCSHEIKVSGNLIKWAVNIFLNDVWKQTTESNFLIDFFLNIRWLEPNEAKPLRKFEKNLVKQHDFLNILNICNTTNNFKMKCALICSEMY